MDPNDDNGDAIIIKKIERNLMVFRGIAYFAIAVILLLFLSMGISWSWYGNSDVLYCADIVDGYYNCYLFWNYFNYCKKENDRH